jgi:hypothetical protein
MQKSGKLYHKMQSKSIQCPADSDEEHPGQDEEPAKQHGDCADEEAPLPTSVKPGEHREESQIVSSGQSTASIDCANLLYIPTCSKKLTLSETQEVPLLSRQSEVAGKGFWTNVKDTIHQFIEELMAPPTISAVRSLFPSPHFAISAIRLLNKSHDKTESRLNFRSDDWICCWPRPMVEIPNHRQRSSSQSRAGFPPTDGVGS